MSVRVVIPYAVAILLGLIGGWVFMAALDHKTGGGALSFSFRLDDDEWSRALPYGSAGQGYVIGNRYYREKDLMGRRI